MQSMASILIGLFLAVLLLLLMWRVFLLDKKISRKEELAEILLQIEKIEKSISKRISGNPVRRVSRICSRDFRI